MRFLLLISFVFIGQSHLFAQMVSNNNDDDVNKVDARMSRNAFREGEILVKFKPQSAVSVKRRANGKFSTSSVGTVDAVLKDIGVEEMEELMPKTGNKQPVNARLKIRDSKMQKAASENLSKLYRVRLSEKNQNLSEPIDKLKALDEVEFAEPNYLVFTTATVDDYQSEPLYAVQWGLNAINLPQLWAVPTITEKRPVIAILDTGVDISHPDLEANIWTNAREANGEEGYDNDNNGFKNDVHGWDFINQTGTIADYNGHGTHCAGIAGAVGDNGVGVVGANPDALIMPVTVMQSDGVGDVATIIRGIDYAAANGADVISMSFGTYAESTALEQALGRAYQTTVLVAAAGNDGLCLNAPHYAKMFPAAYTFVLGVQATMHDDTGILAPFSNYDDNGPVFSQYSESQLYNYELTAPGTAIMSTFPNGNYRQLNGTSMACPLVAGAISRLLQTKVIETKEILFGDLINAKTTGNLDIYKAYQTQDADRKPTIDFVTYDIDDSEGDNDGRIDAGEIVSIYPVLRNEWGTAENIRISLEMGDFEDASLIEMITDEADFGATLIGYAKTKAQNGLKFKVSENCTDARHIKLVLKATCDNITADMSQNITIVVTNAETISGMINSDKTLTADKVWLVENNIAIPEGVTLKIEPGTRVEFNEGVFITCEGNLDIHGEPGNMIVLTNRNGQGKWGGIICIARTSPIIYTNAERSLISFSYSDETPIEWNRGVYINPEKAIYLCNAFDLDHTLFSFEKNDYCTMHTGSIVKYLNNSNKISYCVIDGMASNKNNGSYLYLNNCIVQNSGDIYFGNYGNGISSSSSNFQNNNFLFFTINGSIFTGSTFSDVIGRVYLAYNNIVNNKAHEQYSFPWDYVLPNNIINMMTNSGNSFRFISSSNRSAIKTIKNDTPPYLGTSKEEIARTYCMELGNSSSNNKIDLSNMLTQPIAEAHGIVWKVVVNGYDAQDEFNELPPLGVGRHKFEVYFNRPMNKDVAPMIAMGVRPPYTQTSIAEDGEWNEEGTIYTAYLTISGKNGDGLNHIYVADAQDDEYFEIPIEYSRFNVMVQAAGSMSEGFEATPGLGRVSLEWEAPDDEFADLLGYNIYRYTIDEGGTQSEAVRLNSQLLESNETTYVDYEVTPGQTYYYYYKVMTTDLAENDPSKVVACTPLTSTLGDANGSGDVDVADVITTVNYAAGLDPKPFIFEAADVNNDSQINVIDVVGIIYRILHPEGEVKMRTEATATYTIEDGLLYVESPVALAGIQVTVNSSEQESPSALETLNGFEHVSAWLTDEDCLFLSYNMSGKTLPAGKTAILQIGDAELRDIRLSDAYGVNVTAIPGNATSIIDMSLPTKQQSTGIYNLNGQKVAGSAEHLNRLPKGVYVVGGQKIVK